MTSSTRDVPCAGPNCKRLVRRSSKTGFCLLCFFRAQQVRKSRCVEPDCHNAATPPGKGYCSEHAEAGKTSMDHHTFLLVDKQPVSVARCKCGYERRYPVGRRLTAEDYECPTHESHFDHPTLGRLWRHVLKIKGAGEMTTNVDLMTVAKELLMLSAPGTADWIPYRVYARDHGPALARGYLDAVKALRRISTFSSPTLGLSDEAQIALAALADLSPKAAEPR